MFVFLWPEEFLTRVGWCFGALILALLAVLTVKVSIEFGVELQALLTLAAFLGIFFVRRGLPRVAMLALCFACFVWAGFASETVSQEKQVTSDLASDVGGCPYAGCTNRKDISQAVAWSTEPNLHAALVRVLQSFGYDHIAELRDPAAAQLCSFMLTAAYRMSGGLMGVGTITVDDALQSSGPLPPWVHQTLTKGQMAKVLQELGRPYPINYSQPDPKQGKTFLKEIATCESRFPVLTH